ncbi:MAG: aminotransferase class III-fold pyridoxal phosphate-dependent enzyme, partial [Pseudomonadota bacterium]
VPEIAHRIVEDENLLENVSTMGEYLRGQLEDLAGKHAVIGEVRGKGLFMGAELVADRETREPLPEAMVQGVVADCMKENAVVIGATNRSLPGLNNTLCFSPGFIATRSDIDEMISAVDGALTRVMAA